MRRYWSIFWVGTTNYYDDFTVFEVDSLIDLCTFVAHAFCSLLGWECNDLLGFVLLPDPLGAVLDLEAFKEGRCNNC